MKEIISSQIKWPKKIEQESKEEIKKELEELKKDMFEIKNFIENFEKKFTQLVIELAKREYYRR
ncbi:MAG: hypothetical protein ACTSSF_00175 [Candidatus Heimdallarchaeaceae archaeon]